MTITPAQLKPHEIIAELTQNGRRAATHVIRTPSGKVVVHKRFHPGCEANFEREVHALRDLRAIDPDVVPPVLDVGDMWLTMPYYENVLRQHPLAHRLGYRLLPLHVVRRVFLALRRFYEHGYEIFDMAPCHVILDRTEGVKLIDFEFAYPDAATPGVPFEQSQTIRGPHVNWTRELPSSSWRDTGQWWNRYRRLWLLETGLPLQSVLTDPRWIQQLKRAYCVPTLLVARSTLLIVRSPLRRCLRIARS